MTAAVELGFIQARIQARLARLPSDADWERLSACRTLSSFLEEARSGTLRAWVKGFSAQSRPGAIEAGLRDLAAEQVQEVSSWAPRRWRDAVDWLVWLPLIPLFEHLARGGSAPGWTRQSAVFSGCLDETGRPDPARLERAGLSRLLTSPNQCSVGDVWLHGWRARWPAMGEGSRMRLEVLIDTLQSHLQVFRNARPEETWALRRELREQLHRRLHVNPLEPAGIFAFLGLVLLDLERLRGELLRRALFADAEVA